MKLSEEIKFIDDLSVYIFKYGNCARVIQKDDLSGSSDPLSIDNKIMIKLGEQNKQLEKDKEELLNAVVAIIKDNKNICDGCVYGCDPKCCEICIYKQAEKLIEKHKDK